MLCEGLYSPSHVHSPIGGCWRLVFGKTAPGPRNTSVFTDPGRGTKRHPLLPSWPTIPRPTRSGLAGCPKGETTTSPAQVGALPGKGLGRSRGTRPATASVAPLRVAHHLRRGRHAHARCHWRSHGRVHRRAHGRVHRPRRVHRRPHWRTRRWRLLRARAGAAAAHSAAAGSAAESLDASETTDGLQAALEAAAAVAAAANAATGAALRAAQGL
mmetsp:Transcript_100689/g.307764  ORF Transcript_100689/g.307764 Transcript_100689/m.307764 type:complete len:214 (-) Transcript_100689:224-865(-)